VEEELRLLSCKGNYILDFECGCIIVAEYIAGDIDDLLTLAWLMTSRK